MKKVLITIMCLAAMFAAGTGLKAQETSIILEPGWTWISYPNAEAMDINSALGDFVPVNGDKIRSQFGMVSYVNGRWRGSMTHFIPGWGYQYFSARSEDVEFVFAQASSVSVVTVTPTDVTGLSAVAGGTVTLGEGNHLFARGVCWGTEPNPNIDDNHLSGEAVAGSQTAVLDGLTPNTTYHVRAYAVTDYGLAYGNEQSFTTEPLPSYTVSVSSNPAEYGTATGGGTYWHGQSCTVQATAYAGYIFTNWTENDSMVSTSATYTFTVNADRTLVANYSYVPTGAINGLFSVSASQQVFFSHGNLQYQASTNTWRFADNQFDYVGSTNSNISSSYSGWIDLFGWGTSGYNHGATCYQPWSTSSNYRDYYAYGNSDILSQYNLYDQTGQADWGYNPISNGGNTVNRWHTLTQLEWDYVFNTRTTASGIRYAKANVNNVNGVILLPDDWSSSTYSLDSTNTSDASFSSNTLTDLQWRTLEQAGAVFLPAAGYREGTWVDEVGSRGYYWSASVRFDFAYFMYFDDSGLFTDDRYRYWGQSVRLTTEPLPRYTVSVFSNPAEYGTATGGGTYEHGQSCTVQATANAGYTFANWTENDSVVSKNAAYTFTVNADRTLVANFTTAPTGAIDGKFTINGSGDQMYFSQGNLQYQASTNTWRFAENQYDYIGSTNSNISSTYSGWIDLFGWGTSGWNSGNIYYYPWDSNNSSGSTYGPPGEYDLTGSYANADWGVFNPISNGGNTANQWRTLTQPEWDYVFNTRTTTSGIRYAKANVNNVNGVILLPDDWSSSTYSLSSTNTPDASFSSNTLTPSQWSTLEQAGAVFLPAAGLRIGTSVYDVGSYGSYWSASCSGSYFAYFVYFDDSGLSSDDTFLRYFGQSVRLVHVAE